MSFFRSVLLIGLVSLLISGGLLLLGYEAGYEEFKGGYAVLSTNADIDDKAVTSRLENADFIGGAPVSESSLWVLFDNFDFLEAIPLNEYFSKVDSFDPRYDVYAEKLRDVFLRDDKRFVFIPLTAGSWNSSSVNKQAAFLLGDIPFSVEYYGTGRPLHFFFLMYLAASVFLIVLSCVNKKSRNSSGFTACIVALVPVFSPLAFFGAPGLGCASLFFALFILFREPLNDLVTLSGSFLKSRASSNKSRLALICKEIIVPYRFYAVLLPFFVAAFAVVISFSQLHFLFILAVFAGALLVFLFSLKILSLVVFKRKRFSPVLIIKRVSFGFAFSVYMIPFAAAAVITFFLAPFQTGEYVFNNKFDAFVYEHEYHEHIVNQSTFSVRKFGVYSSSNSSVFSDVNSRGNFPEFFMDTDGLPSMRAAHAVKNIDFSDFPPFPLKGVMSFFEDVNSGLRTNSGNGGINEKWALLMLIIFISICLILYRYYNNLLNVDFSGLKNFSKKMPQKGLNWNKTPLYNERNHKRLLKTGQG
ncbi:MAG: hypothetical protein FWB73_02655 [Treponema sp.]|nr:hypothetical protein [Treponema sp.]